ncbi:MAG: nucleoside 2-deoxyribosyltransferase [Solirubrobacteraceae bacterium]
MKERCYVASPAGFSEATRGWYRDVLLPILSTVVDPVDPRSLTDTDEIEEAHAAGRHREIALEIGRRNAEAIRSCSLLVAHLDGQEADSGTVVELGYAAGRGLRCHGIRSDLRQAGEPGVELNLQVVSLIVLSGGTIEPSADALVRRLRADAGR